MRDESLMEEQGIIAHRSKFIVGNPSTVGRTGNYRLTVESCKSWNEDSITHYLYVLYDSIGQQYNTVSEVQYPENEQLICRVEITKATSGNSYLVSIIGDETSRPVSKEEVKAILREHFVAPPKPQIIHRRKTKAEKKAEKLRIASQKAPLDKYKCGERYNYTVTSDSDEHRNQYLKDNSGNRFLLIDTNTHYDPGESVRCTYRGYATKKKDKEAYGTERLLTEPRIVRSVTVKVRYTNYPQWFGEIQDLGRHKCGKPFTCSCCGGHFPANAGWRVDLREIYLCNSCANEIYEPKGRGNRRFIIYTPMGNKR